MRGGERPGLPFRRQAFLRPRNSAPGVATETFHGCPASSGRMASAACRMAKGLASLNGSIISGRGRYCHGGWSQQQAAFAAPIETRAAKDECPLPFMPVRQNAADGAEERKIWGRRPDICEAIIHKLLQTNVFPAVARSNASRGTENCKIYHLSIGPLLRSKWQSMGVAERLVAAPYQALRIPPADRASFSCSTILRPIPVSSTKNPPCRSCLASLTTIVG